MVEKRLGNLEELVTKIRVNQAGMAKAVDNISEALAALVDMRAESLHIIRAQEEARQDRDEIFGRLRMIEVGREGCLTTHRHIATAIENIEVDVDCIKTWKIKHISTQAYAEKAGLAAGRRWGLSFGALSVVISLVGLYLKVTGKI